jgi:hypothetical protein
MKVMIHSHCTTDLHDGFMDKIATAYLLVLGALGLHTTSFDVSYLQIQAFLHFGTISGQATVVSNPEGPQDLLSTFRIHYHRFEHAIQEASVNPTDSTVLARLGDDLDEFANLVIKVSHPLCVIPGFKNSLYLTFMKNSNVFENAELSTLRHNLGIMQIDIRLQYEEVLDHSHYGRPTVVQRIHTGLHGRPRVHIDPEFLQWAYAH